MCVIYIQILVFVYSMLRNFLLIVENVAKTMVRPLRSLRDN